MAIQVFKTISMKGPGGIAVIAEHDQKMYEKKGYSLIKADAEKKTEKSVEKAADKTTKTVKKSDGK